MRPPSRGELALAMVLVLIVIAGAAAAVALLAGPGPGGPAPPELAEINDVIAGAIRIAREAAQ